MDLDLFFEGKLGREEVSSAVLATLLKHRQDVRDAFFDMLALADCVERELADSFKAKSWQVRVEVDQVDIRLDASDRSWVIFIENKIQAGATQPGQFRRYYEELVQTMEERVAGQNQSDQRPHILAVYLAPRAIGEGEVKNVKLNLRAGDFAGRISWSKVDEYLRALDDSSGFLASGIREIMAAINNAAKEKYPNEGEREPIHEIASQVRDGMQRRFPSIKVSAPWPAENNFILGSYGTNLTIYLVLAFEADPKPPHLPLCLFDGNKMSLSVRSSVKLSGKGGRNPELKARWRRLCGDGTLDIPGIGIHKLQGRWLTHERKISATSDHMVEELTEMGVLLLQVVQEWKGGTA